MRQLTGISQRLPFKTVKNRRGNIFPLIFFRQLPTQLAHKWDYRPKPFFIYEIVRH